MTDSENRESKQHSSSITLSRRAQVLLFSARFFKAALSILAFYLNRISKYQTFAIFD